MKRLHNLILSAVAVVITSLSWHTKTALAESESALDEGIREYTAGKYSDALEHLGGALNSEFNNAKLHYYMGSCYMKLRKKNDAVREFRIAYALEPTGQPGKYAKQALESMDVDKAQAGGASGDVFTKGLQDQKALSRAIADYERQREGANIFNPATFGGFNPPPGGQVPGYMPGGNPNGYPYGTPNGQPLGYPGGTPNAYPNGNPYLPPIPPGQQTTNPPNYYR